MDPKFKLLILRILKSPVLQETSKFGAESLMISNVNRKKNLSIFKVSKINFKNLANFNKIIQTHKKLRTLRDK